MSEIADAPASTKKAAEASPFGAASSASGRIGWPLFLGGWTTAMFFGLVFWGPLHSPALVRYVSGHPVSYVTQTLFFIAVWALALKSWEAFRQRVVSKGVRLTLEEGADVTPASYLAAWKKLSESRRASALGRRLYAAITYASKAPTSPEFSEELQNLSYKDADEQHESYSLIRIATWAMPMLGFLGTVLGIADALGSLDPATFSTDMEGSMKGLTSGLYVAFDTTAQALALSMLVMFVQFFVERGDRKLNALVDERTEATVSPLLNNEFSGARDPRLGAVEKMSLRVLQTLETAVVQQTQAWSRVMEQNRVAWNQELLGAQQTWQNTVALAIGQAAVAHAEKLSDLEEASAERFRKRWDQWQVTFSEQTKAIQAQQRELNELGMTLRSVVEATGDLTSLENALQANLAAVAGAGRFEEAISSLSATIHLLNARLNQPTAPVRVVSAEASDKAA
jgi:biopolymer transport protein ExbB/TolQ